MAFRKKLIEGEKRVALAMLDKLRQLPVPLAGGELLFRPFEDAAPLSLSCVPSTMPGMAQLLDGYGCDTVLKCLSLNSFVYIFLSILLERKIIFVCEVVGVLSAIVISLASFLRPLAWQSMFVPVFPPKLHQFFDAPVPLIVGVTSIDEAWKPRMHDAVFVFVEEDRIEGWNLIDKKTTMPAMRP